MPIHDELGTRMKVFYEAIPQNKLMRRTPVIIRIDGKAFHTFTRGFDKPYDDIMVFAMQNTMKYLCENIQGCVFGYTQSDEITLVLTDYKKFNSAAWFDYEVQKLCSVSASMATMAFNYFFQAKVTQELGPYEFQTSPYWAPCDSMGEYQFGYFKQATFDARCFNIPKEEVCNLIYWRQADASRNSVQMVGHTYFSHKQLQGLTCEQIQEKLFQEENINWNNYPTYFKRGSACIREENGWKIDTEMPMLIGENREYVDKWVYCQEEE